MQTLEAWMEANSLRDADLAARVDGLSRSQISRLRRRKSIPPPQTAVKLAELTGIPVADLLLAKRAA